MATDSQPKQYLKNPYSFGTPIREDTNFFGREEELITIRNTLTALSEGIKQDCALLGPRRIGKSSLLYRIRSEINQNRKFISAYIDLQSIQPRKIESLFREMLSIIGDEYEKKNFRLRDIDLRSQDISEDSKYFVFKKSLAELDKQIYSKKLPRLVLMLDEIEILNDFGGLDLLDWFRGLIQSMRNIVFVVAGSERLLSLTRDYSSPFFNIFKIIVIKPLSTEAATELVRIPASRIGMQIGSADVSHILRSAGNNPYYLQAICHYLVEDLNKDQKRRATTKDILQVIKEGTDYLSPQFSYMWESISYIQRQILYSLALRGETTSSEKLMPESFLPKEELPSRREQENIFEDLVQQQFLRREKNDYWFVAELFADWIVEKVNKDEINRPIGGIKKGKSELNAKDIKLLRNILLRGLTNVETESLILDNFPSVYERISRGMSKSETINILFEHLYRQNNFELFLDVIKDVVPDQYQKEIEYLKGKYE